MNETNDNAAPPSRPRSRVKQVGVIGALVLIVGWIGFQLLMSSVGANTGGEVESAINWRSDYQQALANARANEQPVFLEFTADWCPPCQWMKRHVYSDKQLGKAIESRFVPVQVDASDPGPSEKRLMQKWGVRGIPTMLMLNAEGEPIARSSGRMNKSALLQWVRQSRPAQPRLPQSQPAPPREKQRDSQ